MPNSLREELTALKELARMHWLHFRWGMSYSDASYQVYLEWKARRS